MHKIFNLLRAWLQLPELIAPCDPLAQMSLRDLADLPTARPRRGCAPDRSAVDGTGKCQCPT